MGGVRSMLRFSGSREAAAASARQSRKWTRPKAVVPPSSLDSSNEELLKHLKSVYVESSSTHQTIKNPYRGDTLDDASQGPSNKVEGVKGRGGGGESDVLLTVNQVIQLLNDHKTESKTLEELSKESGVSLEHLSNLVQYFGNFYRRGDPEKIKTDLLELKFHPLHR